MVWRVAAGVALAVWLGGLLVGRWSLPPRTLIVQAWRECPREVSEP